MWRYRHLLRALIERNVRNQFDAMHLGFIWACARPVLYVLVFTWIRHLSEARMGVEIPYPLYVYLGLVVWWYIMDATRGASGAGAAETAVCPESAAPIRTCGWGAGCTCTWGSDCRTVISAGWNNDYLAEVLCGT